MTWPLLTSVGCCRISAVPWTPKIAHSEHQKYSTARDAYVNNTFSAFRGSDAWGDEYDNGYDKYRRALRVSPPTDGCERALTGEVDAYLSVYSLVRTVPRCASERPGSHQRKELAHLTAIKPCALGQLMPIAMRSHLLQSSVIPAFQSTHPTLSAYDMLSFFHQNIFIHIISYHRDFLPASQSRTRSASKLICL